MIDRRPLAPSSRFERVVIYVISLVLLPLIASAVGSARYRSRCDGGDCDLDMFEGITWASVAFVVVLMVVLLIEIVLVLRRRARRNET